MTLGGIGGYFELGLPDHGGFLHDDGVLLNSGRNALEYVLMALGDVKHLYVPYYTCDVVMEPIGKLGISYSYYHINPKLEIESLPSLQSGDYLIYTNYFGIKDEYVKTMASQFRSHLIVDNAQAWFADPIEGVNTIYSPRKFVGLPDGGVAYCVKHIDENRFEQDVSCERCSHLLKRIDLGPAEGYAVYKENSRQLVGQPIKRMSYLTTKMLNSIDFEVVKNKRRTNYEFMYNCLRKQNLFKIPSSDSFACPMVFPYLTDDATLRKKLIENEIYVATYWPNVIDWTTKNDIEYLLARQMQPLPIDHRYGEEDMKRIIGIIQKP